MEAFVSEQDWPRLIDMHSHWGTEQGWRGSPMVTEQHKDALKNYFRWDHSFVSLEEQSAYFRKCGVRVMLTIGYTSLGMPTEEMHEQHEYAFGYAKENPDIVLGNWLAFDPDVPEHFEEFMWCVESAEGLMGLSARQAYNPAWDRYYRVCIEAKIPVMINVGMIARGAGVPGGLGVLLDDSHPRHVDSVAAGYPDMKILAARPAWPWQSEMIAVLLHKGNVWQELHGWSPKYYTPELKREIARRLKDKVMFAADYPMLSYERLVREWREEGYSDEVLENVFHRNAESFLATVKE